MFQFADGVCEARLFFGEFIELLLQRFKCWLSYKRRFGRCSHFITFRFPRWRDFSLDDGRWVGKDVMVRSKGDFYDVG